MMTMDLDDLPPFEAHPPRHQVFLGHDIAEGLRRCWSSDSDSVGIVGPPRYGKSAGVIVPSILQWAGPVVATSTRGDLMRACAGWRSQLAAARGGGVFVYDPLGSEPGVRSLGWSPLAGCTDPSVCYRRVQAMTAVVGQGISEGDHWRGGAAVILRGLFHAAALGGRPLVEVRRWLARQDTADPAALIRAHLTPAVGWADDLEAMQLVGERERGSFYSVARNTLDATAEPRVLASTGGVELDVDRFLLTGSTLFIVGPSHMQTVIAPMIVGLVDSIAQRAAELAAAQGGRLADPLLLALDEVANIAPLESLPQLVSEGGGRGIVTLWAAQSLAQLRGRYGADGQQSILTATTAKVIYGGMSNGEDLRNVSSWAGEVRQPLATAYGGGLPPPPLGPGPLGGLGQASAQQHAVSSLYRPSVPVDVIQQLPPFRALLWYRSDAPVLVETRPAGMVPAYQRLMAPPAVTAGAAGPNGAAGPMGRAPGAPGSPAAAAG